MDIGIITAAKESRENRKLKMISPLLFIHFTNIQYRKPATKHIIKL
jgi:hypothetical protein